MKHSLVVCTVLAFATLAGCRRTVPDRDVLFLQAVEDGNLPRIQALLDNGANVNAGWEEGEALRKAVIYEDVELVRLLLARGAKVNVASWRGWTPLFDAVVRQDNREIAAAVHFSSGSEGLHPAFSELQAGLNEVQKAGNIKLHVANSLWPQKGFELLPDYLALVRTQYGSCITPVDFAQDKVGAYATINQWVEEKTERRIKDLLQPGMLADPTFLVLVNAIYFKGAWENEFDPNDTRDEAFHVSPQRSVQTPLMRQCRRFGYARLDSLQIVELPYRGGECSMLVLLPDRIDGLASLEQSLSANVLATWRSRLKNTEVELLLPKFRITYTVQLRQCLEALGMKDAFLAGKAHFAGVDGRSDRLFLGGVIHKAFVDVNEEGTEAAAATAIGMMAGIPPKPPEFRADHPFLFLIQDNRTGSILFLGCVVDPTQTGE